MRTDSPSTTVRPRLRRVLTIGLTAGTVAAAWVATAAPIHLGMITDLVNGMVP